jgi:hypothetical protein
MLAAIGAALSAISQPVATWLKGRAARQVIKERGKIEIAKARIEGQVLAAKAEAQSEADWDMAVLRQQQYTWRDEWMTILLSYPFVVSFSAPFVDLFVPDQYRISAAIDQAWASVGKAPIWYQVCLIGVVAATFGLRWYITKRDPMSSLKSNG